MSTNHTKTHRIVTANNIVAQYFAGLLIANRITFDFGPKAGDLMHCFWVNDDDHTYSLELLKTAESTLVEEAEQGRYADDERLRFALSMMLWKVLDKQSLDVPGLVEKIKTETLCADDIRAALTGPVESSIDAQTLLPMDLGSMRALYGPVLDPQAAVPKVSEHTPEELNMLMTRFKAHAKAVFDAACAETLTPNMVSDTQTQIRVRYQWKDTMSPCASEDAMPQAEFEQELCASMLIGYHHEILKVMKRLENNGPFKAIRAS